MCWRCEQLRNLTKEEQGLAISKYSDTGLHAALELAKRGRNYAMVDIFEEEIDRRRDSAIQELLQ
jgi:hypothetical protein